MTALERSLTERIEVLEGTLEWAADNDTMMAEAVSRLRVQLARLQQQHDLAMSQRDQYLEELQQLREEIVQWGRIWDDLAMMEGRAEHLRNGTAILGTEP